MLKADLPEKQHPLMTSAIVGKYGIEVNSGLFFNVITTIKRYQITPFANGVKKIEDVLGCDLPQIGFSSSHENLSLIWAGQNSWYLEGDDSVVDIVQKLEGFASVTDQSDAFALIEVSGRVAEDFMLKGCALDFAIQAFPIHKCATSLMAHTNVHIRRITADGFQILVPASYATSFWQWLELSAEEYGYLVAID